ncbi:MAG: nucleotidyltransferase substrate binding protein [Melioribacteraceae bacterium]|nr:nucleotidyltransferase substrate binding protein [Melioribacteraceae bacterium]
MDNKDIRWHQRFSNYQKALKQLKKFIDVMDLNELEEQGLIQAFEYTHELAWKTIKDFLNYQGNQNIYGSKDATREAFNLSIISDGDIWMNMIESRNQTSHTYNDEVAKEIVKNIKEFYFNQFLKLEEKLLRLMK